MPASCCYFTRAWNPRSLQSILDGALYFEAKWLNGEKQIVYNSIDDTHLERKILYHALPYNTSNLTRLTRVVVKKTSRIAGRIVTMSVRGRWSNCTQHLERVCACGMCV